MAKFKKIWIFILAMCMAFAMGVTALASETDVPSGEIDYDCKGSVTVEMLTSDTKTVVSGATLELYEVAAAKLINGDNVFVLTDDFKDSGANLTGISESDAGMPELASELENYVVHNQIEGKAVTVNDSGLAEWADLELGLYLVINKTAAKGYEPIQAFLITVPRYLNGVYLYDVTANPKQDTVDTAVPETPEGTTKTPSTGKQTSTTGTKLPQTGQLWWPVPILACAGVLCVMIGWYGRRRFRRNDREQK